jgi:uncharacterized protein YbcV (DUF1398 family)
MNFTLEQIKQAHSKVKSGADFPAYIQDLIKLGVMGYETFVTDGHTVFQGKNGFAITSEPKYDTLEINAISNKIQFVKDLKHHQQGGSNYLSFCNQSAANGVEKWKVDTIKRTCTYYDLSGNEMLLEHIPSPQ